MTEYKIYRIENCTSNLLSQMVAIEISAHIHPWNSEQLKQSYGDRYYTVGLFKNNNLIGYAIFDYVLDECTLQNICVAPIEQGKKLGKKLLIESLSMIQKDLSIKHVFLEVRVSNIKAVNLYLQTGFKQDGIRKNYYITSDGSKEDAILMGLHN